MSKHTHITLHWQSGIETFRELREQSRKYGYAFSSAHYIIDTKAVLWAGRPLEMPSVLDKENNAESISVLLLGGGMRRPTFEQCDRVSELSLELGLPCEHGPSFPDEAP